MEAESRVMQLQVREAKDGGTPPKLVGEVRCVCVVGGREVDSSSQPSQENNPANPFASGSWPPGL